MKRNRFMTRLKRLKNYILPSPIGEGLGVRLLFPRVSEAAGATLGVGELLHLYYLGLLVAGDDHLGDAFAVGDDEVLLREVDEDDAHLAAVVGVDGAGRVEHRDALLQRQTAAGPHLRLVARRQLHEEARLHKTAFHRPQRNRSLGQVRPEIHPRRLRRLILGQRMVTAVDYLYLHSTMFQIRLQKYTFSAI